MTKNLKYTALCLLVTLLASACSSDGGDTPSTPPTNTQDEINIKAQVWQVMQGAPRRAHTYDDVAALKTEAQFKCTAYQANSNPLVAYIPTTTVDWDNGDNRWEFNHGTDHYYWPASGNLDFFAYMPATLPSYIAADPALTYTAAHNVTFTCSGLPMTNAGQGSSLKEFMFGMALGQNGTDNASGVNLSFQHPFTRIKMELSASQVDPITIKTITFKTIKTGGTFTYNGSTSTWDTSEGASDNFVATLNQTVTITNAVQTLGEPYLMIPQSWTGQIEVRIIWDDWGVQKEETLTASAPTTWKIGYSYTYSFTISKSALIVNVARFTEQW